MFFRQKRAGAYRYLQIVENQSRRRQGTPTTLMNAGAAGCVASQRPNGWSDAFGVAICRKLAAIDAGGEGAGRKGLKRSGSVRIWCSGGYGNGWA